MKFVFISDTHGLHRDLELPPGEVLVHAGDITDHGSEAEVRDFLDWMGDLDYAHKVFIGGNHDLFLEEQPLEFLELLPPGLTYLNNQAHQVGPYRLWGAPHTPDLVGWAFGRPREQLAAHWRYLPPQIDLLITHTPPHGILDRSGSGQTLGCTYLRQELPSRSIKVHVFGHIHASYGQREIGGTTFINASNLDSYRGLINPPVVLEW